MSTAREAGGADKRERICEAAVAVFAEKGFHAARVSDIAKRAGVADGTIYLYFRAKEDLLITIFEEKMTMLLGGLHDAVDDMSDPREKLHGFAQHHFSQLQLHPDLAQVFQVEVRQSHQFLTDYRPVKLWDYLEIVAQLVREGQEQGLFRDEIDPFVAKWAFFGALDQISLQWTLSKHRDRFNLTLAATQVASLFIDGMVVSES